MYMKKTLIALVAMTLAGCSSFKLGAIAYIPYGQTGKFEAGPVTAANEDIQAINPQLPASAEIFTPLIKYSPIK